MEPISYGESFRAVNQHDQCDGSRHSSVPIVACFALAHPKYAEVCPTCDRKTVEAWESTSSGAAAPSEIIDLAELESEGEGAAEVDTNAYPPPRRRGARPTLSRLAGVSANRERLCYC